MNKSTGTAEMAIYFVLVAAIAVVMIVMAAYICKTKWQDSGFECRWSLFTGCQIKTKEGRWIPAESYREVP